MSQRNIGWGLRVFVWLVLFPVFVIPIDCRYKNTTFFLYFADRASRYKFLLITNLTHFFNVFIYLISVHVSSITVLIMRRSNCVNTSSSMISLCK